MFIKELGIGDLELGFESEQLFQYSEFFL